MTWKLPGSPMGKKLHTLSEEGHLKCFWDHHSIPLIESMEYWRLISIINISYITNDVSILLRTKMGIITYAPEKHRLSSW